MAARNEVGAVYAAGLVQGLALVTFPAASGIFTSPEYYGLSSSAYGAMFLPQAVMAILASLLGARLTGLLGIKQVYLAGLGTNLAAMLLLVASQLVMAEETLAYGILLCATTSLGLGFGLTVPTLNTYAAAFFRARVDRAVLLMNALLGLGTALAPVLIALFVGLGVWWGLPLLVAVLLTGLGLFSRRLPLAADAFSRPPAAGSERQALPRRFWVFAAFALLYGIVETMNGNWAALYMGQDLGASPSQASLALTAFWAMVTVGRLLFAGIERWLPTARSYRLLPFVVALAFGLLASLPQDASAATGILAFGLAGLGCSALLPLTISFAQGELTTIAATVAGLAIAFYQMGYGLAAFGVGPLETRLGVSLPTLYGLSAGVALALGALSFVVIRRSAPSAPSRPQPA